MLDLMGETKSSSHLALLKLLSSHLIAKVETMKERELLDLLTMTYPYIGFVELRPVVLQIMEKCSQIPTPLLQSLQEQLPLLHIRPPVRVMQQIWKSNDKALIEALAPLVRAYITQAASSWSVRAVQHLEKNRMEEAEQNHLRSSALFAVDSGSGALSGGALFTPEQPLPAHLDVQSAFQYLQNIAIANPSEETLNSMQNEASILGSLQNNFATLLSAHTEGNPDALRVSELFKSSTLRWDRDTKLPPQLNSYSAASARQFNVPLQLITDYISDQIPLYESTIRFIRRLMMEIQLFQLKQRSGADFERSFPMLSSLGVLKLFTIYETRAGVSSSDMVRVPVGVDPALAQILASLRFDVLMSQHDRTHTQVCERDELYRFVWCLDAVRREKSVEDRHFDEMEDIFSRVQAQLIPLFKSSSKKASQADLSSSSATGSITRAKKSGKGAEPSPEPQLKTVVAASSTKLVIGKKGSGSASTTVVSTVDSEKKPAKRATRRNTKIEPEEPSEPATPIAMTRKERSSAARDAIRAAMGGFDEEEDDYESDEEKRVMSRPTRLKKAKASSAARNDSHSSDEDFYLSDNEGPKRKKAKKAGKSAQRSKREEDAAWEADLTEDEEDDDEDAGAKDDADDEEYTGLSDEEEEGNEMAVDDEDFEDELAPRKSKAKRKTKTTEASLAKQGKSAKATSTASGGAAKVSMTGLTGTGTLISQSNASRLASGGMASGIKLKRGNQVLVDTAATLLNFGASPEAKASAALATLVATSELESSINFIAECGWVLSSGSIQMTLLTILFTKMKDIAMRLSKPPSLANCDPQHDTDSVLKIISGDKSISRLMTLLQLSCADLPVLHADGLDNPTVVGTLAERLLETQVVTNLLASSLASVSTKPWMKKKVETSNLNQIDRIIHLLTETVILTAYSERHAHRSANVEAIKAGDDEIAIENEEKRFEAIMAKSKRHQMASGDLPPNITRSILLAIAGEDQDSEKEDSEITVHALTHPEPALSLVLFWSLTQAGSSNENVANSISSWVRTDSKVWTHPKTGSWLLLAYPSFIQEILFGFARTAASSPVLALRPAMIDRMLVGEDQPSLSNSNFGVAQLLSYLYLSLSHGSISKADAKHLLSSFSSATERLREVVIFERIFVSLCSAIDSLSD